MKKKIITCVIMSLGLICNSAKAQIYSPHLANYNGVGTIFYSYGYYQGQVQYGVAHGGGFFYWFDGSFFKGNFNNGLSNGPGLLVSRQYGYVAGCWSQGMYQGFCYQAQTFQNPSAVRSAVRQVSTAVRSQQRKADSDDIVAFNVDDYKISEVDGDTQLGQELLGSYDNAGN